MMMPAFKPRYMLTVFLALCFVFTVAAMTTHGPSSIAMLILVLCFESVSLHHLTSIVGSHD
jgi:FHS family L-fucose permease-like MFS transporter